MRYAMPPADVGDQRDSSTIVGLPSTTSSFEASTLACFCSFRPASFARAKS